MDRRKKLVVVVVHGVSWVWSRLQFGMGTVALVGPQVGFRPHGSRASSRPRCISGSDGSFPFFFLLLVWYTLAPHLFVRKKARLHARQKKIHLPSVRAPLLLNLGGKGLAQTRLQANHITAF